MTQSPNGYETKKNKTASRFFWAAILVLAGLTLLLTLVGTLRNSEPAGPTTFEIPKTTLETILSEAAEKAQVIVAPETETILQNVYAPVYAAIPEYADFHYSVLGEYVELTEAAFGQMSHGLYDRLFKGFEQRLSDAATLLDQKYSEAYRSALKEQIETTIPTEQLSLPLGELTQAALEDAVSRARVTLPLASVVAGVAGSGTLKVVAATVAKKMAAKVAAKAAAKGVAKGGGFLAGAGGGALLCSWSGPGAALCGIVGGTAAWLLADAAVVNIDEYFNRDEFEAELRALIDEDRAARQLLIEEALRNKAAQMDAATNEIMKDFTLRDLSSGN